MSGSRGSTHGICTDELRITGPDAVVDYFLSLNEIREGERVLADDETGPFREFVAHRMAREGALRATTSSGMFVCRSWRAIGRQL